MQKKINSNNFVEHEKMKMTVRNVKVLDCFRRQRLNRQALEMVLSRLETMHGFAQNLPREFLKSNPQDVSREPHNGTICIACILANRYAPID